LVAERRGFKERDFALLHPGGQLGRKLLLRVADIMRTQEANPIVREDARVKDVLLAVTKARAGCASVVNRRGQLIGIFTDGDLRRHLDTTPNLTAWRVRDVMSRNPKTIASTRLAAEALGLLREHKIDELVVVDGDRRPVGLLDVQDLLKAGFV
jgi:arabinose-5-phosphate isomerase